MSFPLLIDPQTQANRWIKTKEHEAGLRIAKLSQDTLVKTVEMCLRMG
jgi:dynein heavy chain